MKKVLVTGVNSYIGNAVSDYLAVWNKEQERVQKRGQETDHEASHEPQLFQIDKISLRDGSWEKADLSGYDAILHVAGKAHADVGHVSRETKAEYYQVNTELTARLAGKAKQAGVGQFIYLSSIIVYGDSAGVGKDKLITAQTVPRPANFYGDSKLQAEKKLENLADDSFRVAVLRPPMIYGRGSRGNFPMLEKIADRLPVFPDMKNSRSMLYVENLAELIRQLIEKGEGGLFFPQNGEYVSTAHMVQLIGRAKGKRLRLLSLFNPFVWLASKIPGKIGALCNKAFGSLTVDKELSAACGYDYQKYSLEESIRRIYEN